MNINSYPSVYAIGHSAIKEIFNGYVYIEEKIDGSQFSFGIIDGELQCRSKGKQIVLDAPDQMFIKAVETVKSIANQLTHGWVYRCEYLMRPKHNVLAYSRVPRHNLILFDIQTGLEEYCTPPEKRFWANELDLECVSLLDYGYVEHFDYLKALLDHESILGGTKIEGFVVKNYHVFTPEKKIAIGKYVSEAFKEVNQSEWRANNPTSNDIIRDLILRYKTEVRWHKAIQHLRDAGQLEGSPRDIGLLIKEIPNDIRKECEEEIKQALFGYAWDKIKRGVISGFPEWYKDELAKSAFESEAHP